MANLNFRTVLLSILFLFLLTISARAAILKGHVIDMDTHEHIAGAFVDVIGTKNIYVSDVNGYFEFDDLSKGAYVLSAKIMGYKSSVTDAIEINSNDAVVVFDIYKKTDSKELNDVEVKGVKNKETDVSARLDEKMASNVINIISAKTIEQLPDLNVADVMQRVSGVSMVKNSTGDNTEAIIRGMPPRYSSTMINGTEAPSTSGSTRSVSLDMIPSSLVGRIEVTKALTPDQEANGLGGTVNIEMKDAPANPLFYIDLSSGYNQYFFSHDIYTFNTSIVNMKDPAESNLAKYPDYTYVSNLSDFTRPNMLVTTKNPLPSINGNFAFGHRFFHDKLGVLISATVNNKSEGSIDYFLDPLPNHNNSLDIDSRNKREYDTQTMTIGSNVKLDYQLDKNNKISLYNSFFQMIQDRVRMESDTSVDIQGRVGSQVVTNIDISTLNSTNLQGHHQLNPHLDLDWSLIYSVATSQSPDLVTESFFQIILPKVQPLYLNYNGSLTREWQHNTDENKTAYLNLKYKTTLFDHFFEFKAGGMFRDKYRNNYANEYSFDAPIVNPPYPDMNTVVMRQNGNVQQANGNPINNPGNYKATEDIEAGYIQLKTSFGKLQILTGVRMEFTQQTNFHSETQYVQVPFTRNVYGYYDLLPSLHLNYKATEDQNIRLSVYQGISRPNYTELVDYLAQGVNGGYQGNKYLRHSTGTCFDTRYEIYPEKEEVFTAGIFYKYIQRPIEDVLGANNNITPSNGPNCANYGFELVGIKYLGNFGVSANYTYTKSVINVSKIFYLPTDSVNPSRRNETRPLVGQSPHIINLALIYRDVKNGLKFQVVYTMQGENIKKTSEYYGEDVYQKTFHDVGATFEKNITKKFYVYAKGSNLLNSKLQFQTKSGINLENISTSASYLIGLKYNF
jgi:hypothetical protein